ncbi:metallophosphoesterase family protein [Acidicapsa ligni]|uniref:metallophosphoesterase family protein n=1 Tax=Acidicapsa ligni TaxID=542300 RepID=UPI0021E06854|nr:metallophosphoesterase [Acidicapsa ligni]
MLRRAFLQNSLALTLAPAGKILAAPAGYLDQKLLPKANPERDFDFVFFTDAHMQPELGAAAACAKCFNQINESRPDFCIAGGDQVFDVCEQGLDRAHLLFKQYRQAEAELACKVYHTVGNHDVTGINQKSPFEPGDPEYGKKLYQENFGKLYYSYDYKGWHFIVLDSIGIQYYKIFSPHFDGAQLNWLEADLAAVGPTTPVVVVTHVPITSMLGSFSTDQRGPIVANSYAVHALLAKSNVKLVLQGHLHVWEKSQYHGTEYLIGGAVSGAWWKGKMEDGSSEGYTLCQVRGDEIVTSYVTYPWVAANHLT